MANMVYPDWTAVWSGSALSQNLGSLRFFNFGIVFPSVMTENQGDLLVTDLNDQRYLKHHLGPDHQGNEYWVI